jgi:hypothetical protein
MDQATRDLINMHLDEIEAHAAAIRQLIEVPWWEALTPPYKLPPQNKVITFYTAAGELFSPSQARTVTWEMDVFERNGDLLRVTQTVPAGNYTPREPWWVRAADLTPP